VEIAKIKAIFHWGAEFDHHHDVKFGKAFARAPKNLVVKYKNEGGKKVYTPEEIHRILGVADRQLRVIVLMAINTSFGNRDLSSLPESALDLQNGWVEFSRVKTGVQRRVPLWPETVKAIREWLPKRPKPTDKDAQGLVFLTSTGRRWIRNEGRSDVLGAKFSRLLKRLKINGRRALGMYSLRHSMATIGANCRDTDAVRAILGHVDQHTSAAYIESISDDRLLAVTETVRVWLFGAEGGAE
jgi:integrase